MAYQLSFQKDSLAFLAGVVGVINPAIMIPLLLWHYRTRARSDFNLAIRSIPPGTMNSTELIVASALASD